MQITKRVGGILLDAGADLLHDLEVDADEIVTAHAGLARNAGGDDADAGALDIGVSVGALEVAIEAFDRARLGDVERFALGHAFRDVEENNVSEFFQAHKMSQRAADHASADQRDLGPRHVRGISLSCKLRRP